MKGRQPSELSFDTQQMVVQYKLNTAEATERVLTHASELQPHTVWRKHAPVLHAWCWETGQYSGCNWTCIFYYCVRNSSQTAWQTWV